MEHSIRVIVKTNEKYCDPDCRWIHCSEWGVDCIMFPPKGFRELGWVKEGYLRTERCLERFPK